MSFNRGCRSHAVQRQIHGTSFQNLAATDERLNSEASSVESIISNTSLHINTNEHKHHQGNTLFSTITSSCDDVTAGRISHWAVSFDRLLEDELGVKYFKDFLRKEFSEENILFWEVCEKLRTSTSNDKEEMKADIISIYKRFLAPDALTSVNIDSKGQQLAEEALTSAPHPNIFSNQQEQIYTLMKLDSYSRFLKSTFYRQCVVSEMEGNPLPLESQNSGNSEHSSFRKVSKSFDAGIAQRKSKKEKGSKKALFSFKNRSKSQRESRFQEPWSVVDSGNQVEEFSNREPTHPVSRASSLPGNSLTFLNPNQVCHVTLWDNTSTVLCLKNGATVGEALDGLCESKGIKLSSLDVYLADEFTDNNDGKPKRPLSLELDVSVLASEAIVLERKSVFRLDLLAVERSVGIKARATRSIAEVLRPVLEKYNLKLENLLVKDSVEQNELLLHQPVSTLDGLRIVVEEKPLPMKKDDKQQKKQWRKDDAVRQKNKSKNENVVPDMKEAEALFDLMTSLQASQLDDQRGLISEADLELPEFLKLKPININCNNNVIYDIVRQWAVEPRDVQPRLWSSTDEHAAGETSDQIHPIMTNRANKHVAEKKRSPQYIKYPISYPV